MPVADVNDCRCYYEVTGSGPALLFMHGGFGGLGTGRLPSRPEWLTDFESVSTVVAYDRRSSGRSGAPEGQHSLVQFADDAHALLRLLDLDRAIVWGNSAGVAVASTFAMRHPEATSAVLFTDGAPWFSRDGALLSRLRDRIELLKRDGAEAAYAARREHGTVGLDVFSSRRPTSDQRADASLAAIRGVLGETSKEERIRAYASELRTYEAYLEFDISLRLEELPMPVFVAYGTSDLIFPAVDWPALIGGLGNFEYVAVKGGEHGVASDPRVQRLALDFVQRVSSGRWTPQHHTTIVEVG